MTDEWPKIGRFTATQIDLLRIDGDGRGHTLHPGGEEVQLDTAGEYEMRRIWLDNPDVRTLFGVEPPEAWRVLAGSGRGRW